MANYKTLTYLFGIFCIILLLIVIFAGKRTIYVCYDGTEQKIATKCTAVPPLYITQKQADSAVTTYSNAYALSKGDRSSVVNTYRLNTSWRSEVLFSNVKSQEVHKVLFNIDGKTSTINCLEGCDYLDGLNASN